MPFSLAARMRVSTICESLVYSVCCFTSTENESGRKQVYPHSMNHFDEIVLFGFVNMWKLRRMYGQLPPVSQYHTGEGKLLLRRKNGGSTRSLPFDATIRRLAELVITRILTSGWRLVSWIRCTSVWMDDMHLANVCAPEPQTIIIVYFIARWVELELVVTSDTARRVLQVIHKFVWVDLGGRTEKLAFP